MEKVQVVSVHDSSLRFCLEPLRKYIPEGELYSVIEMRHTRDNLIKIGEMVCKPRKIEIWPSGKCRLWYSEPKGKSFAQISWAMLVTMENY